jgi:hypothetical protein
MCRPRVGESHPLFSICRALWRPTALSKIKKAVGPQRNLGLGRLFKVLFYITDMSVIALQLFGRQQRPPSLWSRFALFRTALVLFVAMILPFLCPMPIDIWLQWLSCTRFFDRHFVLFLPYSLRCSRHLWFLAISWYII